MLVYSTDISECHSALCMPNKRLSVRDQASKLHWRPIRWHYEGFYFVHFSLIPNKDGCFIRKCSHRETLMWVTVMIKSSRYLCICDRSSKEQKWTSIPKWVTCLFWFAILYSKLFSTFLNAACPSGSFKASQGDQQCLQCPINSRTSNEGATNCICRSGYYRTDSDPLQMPCTSMLFSYAILYHLQWFWLSFSKIRQTLIFKAFRNGIFTVQMVINNHAWYAGIPYWLLAKIKKIFLLFLL